MAPNLSVKTCLEKKNRIQESKYMSSLLRMLLLATRASIVIVVVVTSNNQSISSKRILYTKYLKYQHHIIL